MTAQIWAPVNVSHEALVALLEDVLEHVRQGDSFEGHVTYAIPEDPASPPHSFDVEARFRIGNLQGQGGLRMIGRWVDAPPP